MLTEKFTKTILRTFKRFWNWFRRIVLTSDLILATFCSGFFFWIASSLVLFFELGETVCLLFLYVGLFILAVGCVFGILAVCFGMVKDLDN